MATTIDTIIPMSEAIGPPEPPIRVPPTPPPLPTLPDYVPPLDTGQPSTEDLNDLSQFRRLNVAAENTLIPTCYGRDRFFGAIMVVHIDETNGFMYVAYGFCKGEIQAFERIFMDGVDILATDGFLSVVDSVKEEHLGTTSQTASTLLTAAIAGFSDTYPDLAYLVFKIPTEATQGFPRVEAIIQGKKIHDPRDGAMGGGNIVRIAQNTTPTAALRPTIAVSAEAWIRLRIGWDADNTNLDVIDNFNDVASSEAGWRVRVTTGGEVEFRIFVDTAVQKFVTTTLSTLLTDEQIHHIAVSYDSAVGARVMRLYFDGEQIATNDLSAESFTLWTIPYAVSPVFEVGVNGFADVSDIRVWDAERTADQIRKNFERRLVGDETGLVGYWPIDETAGTNLDDKTAGSANDLTLDGSADTLVTGTQFKGLKPSSISPRKFSTNPSMCFGDFVETFADWALNYDDVIAAIAFNDENVGEAPRHQLGLTLFKPTTVDNWTKGFRLYCGCYIPWEGGKLRMIPNRADVEAPGAAFFNGDAGTRIGMGDPIILDFTASDDFSIEFWFKTTTSGSVQVLVGKKATIAGADVGYILYLDASDNLVCRIHDGTNTAADTDSTTNFLDGVWHHIAMTINQTANDMIVYVDGVARTTVNITTVTGTLANGEEFRLGADGSAFDRFIGEIDEVRVWDDVRGATEIIDNRVSEIANPTTDLSLIGYWKLNDVTGSIASDSSKSGINGSLAGGVGFSKGNELVIPDGIVRHFTADDIANRGFQLRKKPSRAFPTQVQVEYTDASGKNWPIARQKASAVGVDEGTTSKRISRVSLPGIHTASQAKRCAIERLNWFLSDLECTLPIFDEGLEVQQGSVVAVTHPIGLTSKLFRVVRVTGASGRWILDLAEYDPAIYSNAVIADPTFSDTQLGDPLTPPVVTGLSVVEELYITKDGNTGSRVRVTWTDTNYPFLSQYRVEGVVGGQIVWQVFTANNEATSPGVEQLVSSAPVSYDVNVFIHSGFAVGSAASANLQIQGKLAAPGDVPSVTTIRIGADSVRVNWGRATDIDIWRYEVRQGLTTDTWTTATSLEFVDGLSLVVEGLGTATAHRFFVKAIDSVRNESVGEAFSDITLSDPTPVAVLNGFEIGGEVRLSWDAPSDQFVARYRVARVDFPTPTTETTLDIVDTLTFNTKDVPAGDYTFRVYSRDGVGNETATPASKQIAVTLDTDAFLADTFDFVSPALTNMVSFDLRLNSSQLWITNNATSFVSVPSDFNAHSADSLANYHTATASEWLSETKDFGLLLTGNWILTHDVETLSGIVTVELELSVAGFGTDSTTFLDGSAKGAFRFARVRIVTSNPSGEDTAFVKSPIMNLKVNVVPIEESGSAISLASEGETIILSREYVALKEIMVQPKNVAVARTAVVDNIIIGLNTGVQTDTGSYLQGGDVGLFDFGATQNWSVECYLKHSGGSLVDRVVVGKRAGAGVGWQLKINESTEDIALIIDDGSNGVTGTMTDAVPNDGQWHHIAYTIDRTGDLMRMYVDGVEDTGSGSPVSTSVVTGALDAGIQPFRVFANDTGGELWENGSVDELRMWNDIRTLSEISDNKDIEVDVDIEIADLLGYWRMDGTVSAVVATVQDETTNNNDLVAAGSGVITHIDPGVAGNLIQKINSFDVYIFDSDGVQTINDFQWKWEAV